MLFSSVEFYYFFLIVFGGAIFLRPYRQWFALYLLMVGFCFYGFWQWSLVGLLVLFIGVNYFLLNFVGGKRSVLAAICLFNVGLLAYYKYTNFVVDSFFQVMNGAKPPDLWSIVAPVGLSFLVFRAIAHAFDVYRGQISSFPVWYEYALYISFFPQIAAGPLARAKDFYADLRDDEGGYHYETGEVFVLISGGLFKKLVVSSFLFDFIDGPFHTPENYSSMDLYIAMFAYGCYLYMDFSGYSDMSNGVSSLLGFRPVLNFASPYRSKSLSEFWNRWHVSLSHWFRDYVYIVMGGNGRDAQGVWRQHLVKVRNLLGVMLLSGLWHGAGFTFLLWGFLHGVGLVFDHCFAVWKKSKETATNLVGRWKKKLVWESKKFILQKVEPKSFFQRFGGVASWLVTLHVVFLLWVVFAVDNIELARRYFEQLFVGGFESGQSWNLLDARLLVVIGLVLAGNFVGEYCRNKFLFFWRRGNFWWQVSLAVLVFVLIWGFKPTLMPPFVYFSF